MNVHKNVRLTAKGREVLVQRLERGKRVYDWACVIGVSARTVYKWRHRYRQHGLVGLQDRLSRSRRIPALTSAVVQTQTILLRKQKRTYDRIGEQTGPSWSTVAHILVRYGLNRWRDLELAEPVIRYKRQHPGELIHMDIKKLGKFA